MKFAASIIVMLSLVMGIIAATTAYLPSLDVVEQSGQTLTLNAPAGLKTDENGKVVALYDPAVAKKNKEVIALTPEVIAAIRASQPEQEKIRVRVKEFSLARWDHKWIFFLSVAGLLAGAFMLRSVAAQDIAESKREMAEGGSRKLSPSAALHTALAEAKKLQMDRATTTSAAKRMHDMLEGIDRIRSTYFVPFVDARPVLIGTYGMAGFAQVMDKFAAAERQFNRSWSAAADNVLAEAEPCLDEAIARLELAIERVDA
ncbi:MAG: hypothetical protein KC983_07680 [Phycisphaerales bacterium]|nr:hypothetical protein [Phycisphaerales bacterium]